MISPPITPVEVAVSTLKNIPSIAVSCCMCGPVVRAGDERRDATARAGGRVRKGGAAHGGAQFRELFVEQRGGGPDEAALLKPWY
jgi:hypothetical protein